jgi:hypothetical protein
MTHRTQSNPDKRPTHAELEPSESPNPLDTPFFDGHERMPIRPHAPPAGAFTHWLSVEQIRIMQRMRRQTVIDAMESGELPFEKRGRVRYARLSDVLAWEERRLSHTTLESKRTIDPDLEDLAG